MISTLVNVFFNKSVTKKKVKLNMLIFIKADIHHSLFYIKIEC